MIEKFGKNENVFICRKNIEQNLKFSKMKKMFSPHCFQWYPKMWNKTKIATISKNKKLLKNADKISKIQM